MSNKFESFLAAAGKDFEKGLGIAVKEAPAVGALVSLIWPPAAVAVPVVETALNLLQNSILAIEQKYAASGVQSGTGTQKAAEVLSLSGPAAIQLLTSAGVKNVDSTYIQNIVTAIVAILNVAQPAVAAPAAVTA